MFKMLPQKAAKVLIAGVLVTGLGAVSQSGQITHAANFEDLAPDYWAVDTIKWAVDNKIVTGYPDNTIRPAKPITEAEFLTLFFRSFGITADPIGGNTHWADGYYSIAWDKEYPVLGKYNTGVKNTPIKRSKVAEIIAAADGFNYSGNDAVHYMLGKEYAKGRYTTVVSISSYQGHENITRAESLQLIRNLKGMGFNELKNRPGTPSSKDTLPRIPAMLSGTALEIEKVLLDTIAKPEYVGYFITSRDNSLSVNKGTSKVFDPIVTVTLKTNENETNILTVYEGKNSQALKLTSLVLNTYGIKVDSSLSTQIKNVVDSGETFKGNVGGKAYSITDRPDIKYDNKVVIKF